MTVDADKSPEPDPPPGSKRSPESEPVVNSESVAESEHGPHQVRRAELLESPSAVTAQDALKLTLAGQVAPRRWRRHLQAVVRHLDHGVPLDEALRQQASAMPRELRCLFQEAMVVPDPTSLLVEAVRARADVRQGWRELISIILYPLGLFVVALSIGVGFSYAMTQMVDMNWIDQFGFAGFDSTVTNLVDQHHAVVGLAVITAWVGIMLLTIALVGPSWAWIAVLGGFVLIGKPLRWTSLREILHRFELFVSQGLSTLDAANSVSRSFSSSSQAVVTRAIARRIEAGMPLGKALGASMLTDGLCRPALLMLDDSDDISRSMGKTADLLGQMTDQRCQMLGSILPVFVLSLVGTILWATLSAYFVGLMPLFNMLWYF